MSHHDPHGRILVNAAELDRLRADLAAERALREKAEQEAAGLRADLIRANLDIARYREAWGEMGEVIQAARMDLTGEKDKPIPAARAGGEQ